MFFLFYFPFILFFVFLMLGRPEQVDPVGLTLLGLTRSSQLKTNRRKETRNKTNQKWKKHKNSKSFQ
jgi:hypothetical protein